LWEEQASEMKAGSFAARVEQIESSGLPAPFAAAAETRSEF